MSHGIKLIRARLNEIGATSSIVRERIREAINNDDHEAQFFFLSYEDEERPQSEIEKEIGLLVAVVQELSWRVKDCDELQAIEKTVKYFKTILGPE